MKKDFVYCSDEVLVEEIKVDNMFAFDFLYKKYSKQAYKFAYSILKSKEETENIVQDVFLSLWENRSKIEKYSSVKYYIFTITHNSVISLIRKKINEIHFVKYLALIQTKEQVAVDSILEYKELTNRLEKIIDNLPERQKEVYLLHFEGGLKYNEIASKLKISSNTIENHMSRALRTIRLKLYQSSFVSFPFFSILFIL